MKSTIILMLSALLGAGMLYGCAESGGESDDEVSADSDASDVDDIESPTPSPMACNGPTPTYCACLGSCKKSCGGTPACNVQCSLLCDP